MTSSSGAGEGPGSVQSRGPWIGAVQGSVDRCRPGIRGSVQSRDLWISAGQGSVDRCSPGVRGSVQARGPWIGAGQGSVDRFITCTTRFQSLS